MRLLNKDEINDILYGCTVLGTGGGGDLNAGLDMINDDIQNGLEFKLISLDKIPNNALVSSPYQCGCVSLSSTKGMTEQNGLDGDVGLVAFKTLSEYIGQPFFACLPGELGGYNTAIAMSVAAKAGIPFVDADLAGRSVPELQHSTLYMHNIAKTPIAVANKYGDVVIIKKVASEYRTEAIVRSLAIISEQSIGVCDPPICGERLKKAVIPGTVSYSEKIGKSLRDAWRTGKDPATVVAEAGNGYILLRGIVSDYLWKISDGFTIGDIYIKGTDEYEGNKLRIWFKNENLISWMNDKIYVTVPDLICVFDMKTAKPVTNPNIAIGMDVSVIGLPSPEVWRTEKGLELLGPRHFGYNIQYVPLEYKVGK